MDTLRENLNLVREESDVGEVTRRFEQIAVKWS